MQDECVHGWLIKIGLTYRIRQECEFFPNNGKKIYPESLGMFTGLYDTNDKPIYANIPLPDGSMSRGGDIIQVKDGYMGKQAYGYTRISHVFFHRGAFYFSGSLNDVLLSEPQPYLDELKVIGNAYENPELLEDKS